MTETSQLTAEPAFSVIVPNLEPERLESFFRQTAPFAAPPCGSWRKWATGRKAGGDPRMFDLWRRSSVNGVQ